MQIRKFISAVAMLAGTIIGVGLFSLPYVTLRVGWPLILAYFFVVGTAVILVHYLYAELALVTPDHKRLPGFAKYHWKRGIGRYLPLATHPLSLLGTTVAYIIVGGGFFHSLLHPYFGGSPEWYALAFWALGSALMFMGTRAVARMQVIGLVAFIAVLLGLAWFARASFDVAQVTARIYDETSWFAPFGVIMFALWGVALVPQVEEMLDGSKYLLKKVVVVALLIPIIVYLSFIVLVQGVAGINTTSSALTGLSQLGDTVEAILLIFGLITTFTSFVVIGMTLQQVLHFDIRFSHVLSWSATFALPIIMYFFGVQNFIELISLIGAVILAFDGINIMLMHRKAMPNAPAWKRATRLILMGMLVAGIFNAVLYLRL